MDTIIAANADGRTIITGCGMLPPVKDHDTAQKATIPKAESKRSKGERNKATTNRFAVLNAFVDCSMTELTKADLASWFILYRDTKNGTVCTSQSDIARRAGVSVRSVRKAIRKLIDFGLLVVVFQGGLNRGASRYRVVPLGNASSSVQRKKSVRD